MTSILDGSTACADGAQQAALPDNPFTALHYHFGMLLGVDDLETEQGFHHGKMRLHNAWLHREGVVWGLGVEADPEHREIRVLPGLALDAAGRELHLDLAACVDVGAWFDAHKDDPGFDYTEAAGKVVFDAHVEIAYDACLSRPVPALAEPCAGAGAAGETAFSRTVETVVLRLVPGKAAARAVPYHRLRLLFGLDAPAAGAADQDVLDARAAVLAKPLDERPAALLEAFRRFAALDVVELEPAQTAEGDERTLFPALEDASVALADVTGITLTGSAGAWSLATAAVDQTVRPSHVATATVEELLCGDLLGPGAAAAAGPTLSLENIDAANKLVVLKASRPLAAKSVVDAAFSVSTFAAATGWKLLKAKASLAGDGVTITLTLADKPAGDLVRIGAAGTGPRPVLGADLVPLAGATSPPAGAVADGLDFLLTLKGSQL